MAKYSKSAKKSVGRAVGRLKDKKLVSGSGAKVKDRKQAIAIGLSEARSKGAKVPAKKAAPKKASYKSSVVKKAAPKKAAAKKPVKKAAPKKAAPKKAAAKKAAPKKAVAVKSKRGRKKTK